MKVGRHEVELYEGIDSLPIARYQKFNRLMLVDSGVGSTIEELDTHLKRATLYCKTNPDHTYTELLNLRQSFNMATNGIHPGMIAFGAFVKSLDGKEYPVHITDEQLKEIHTILSDVTVSELSEANEAVKKKIEGEMSMYFPSMGDSPQIKEYYDLKLQLLTAMLDQTANGTDRGDEIQSLTDQLTVYYPPRCFQGEKSVEIQSDKEFTEMCLLITKEMHINAKDMTVFDFYSAFEMIKRQSKKAKK
jgi:hypothetical protein